MGYSFTIGNLEVEKEPENGLDSDCISFSAKGVKLAGSPAFGEPTDETNQRWPSYSSWSNFLDSVGLYEVFFNENGHLIGGHPGVRLVTKEMVDVVSNKRSELEEANPALKADFNTGRVIDGYYCRLIWLDYWLKWSFENCETPVIANS
ncbi:hypothetical protein [Pantoea trifolii]|uniref:hypothetical protein n=1 Tax=Candidatus Pantoea symbiotica TaxID=1884370 RepID=UPI002413079B|nr:hypothetical protein [Pantoea rodasii]